MVQFEAAETVKMALSKASFGPHLKACAFRMLDSIDETEFWAEVVAILDRSQWDEIASEACEQARSEIRRVLEEVNIRVILICRTGTEHQSFKDREIGIWTAIDPNVTC